MNLNKSVGIVGTPLAIATLFMGAASPAGAETVAAPDMNVIDKYLVQEEITWKGVVVYQDSETKEIKESEVLEVSSWCTGSFVSKDGYVLTAGHCFDVNQARNALIDEFRFPMPDEDELLATGPIIDDFPEIDTSRMNAIIVDVHGVPDMIDGTGSDPQPVVHVSQPMGVDGTVLDHEPVVPAHIVDVPLMEHGDVALLKVEGLSKETPALPIAALTPKTGEEATVIGYPGEVFDALDKNPMLHASVKTGKISTLQPSSVFGWPALEIDSVMAGGMSGGPVMVNGQVVGTVSHGLPEGTNYSTDTESVRRLLERNSVPMMDPATSSAPDAVFASKASDDSANGPTIALAVVAMALFIALATIATLTRKTWVWRVAHCIQWIIPQRKVAAPAHQLSNKS